MTEVLYDDDFLLDKFDSIKKDKKKAVFFFPKIERDIKHKKTTVIGFDKFCSSVKRNNQEIKLFIEINTNFKISMLNNGDLIIDNVKSTIENQIKDVLEKYVKSKVLCQEPKCNSGNTEIIKENRITFIFCNTCKSKKSLS
jgi:translation initiation factor 2 subunit 2